VLHARVNWAYRRLHEYLSAHDTWGATHTGVLGHRPVAYFSAEFGIHESLPIYSGGLGILAGDHLKSASDLGPMAQRRFTSLPLRTSRNPTCNW
jgi:starch phosphorylase